MENTTVMSVQFDIAAQKILNQVMIQNEHIEKDIESGFKNAFESFDFKAAIENAVTETIKAQISSSTHYGKLRDIIDSRVTKIMEDLIAERFKDGLI